MTQIHGLAWCVWAATHNRGSTLDIVASRVDLLSPAVDVVDVGLSDHRLLRWSTSLARPPPVYSSVTRRPWRMLDHAAFRAALQSSPLCDSGQWPQLDVDGFAGLYDGEITTILGRLLPVHTVRCQRRSSDPWFDEDCRAVKQCVRLLERRARRAVPAAAAAATADWNDRRRAYRHLLLTKREAFWRSKVDAECSSPRQLWRSIDALMGRAHGPSSDVVCCRRGRTIYIASSTTRSPACERRRLMLRRRHSLLHRPPVHSTVSEL